MRLIIISNRLPVTVVKEEEVLTLRPSAGGLASGLTRYLNSKARGKIVEDYIWIGWPGVYVEDKFKDDLANVLLRDHNCHPVFLEKAEIEGFYSGFCNKTIWPLFHYFSDKTELNPTSWEQYKAVNYLFAAAVDMVICKEDIIWVHDYHLMLLPQILREKYPTALIGFFLHIPFPAYEMFRLLASNWQADLLMGLLGADIVGFHTAEYVQHFKICLLKVKALESKDNKLFVDERVLKVACLPMGIDFNYFFQTAKSIRNKRSVTALQKSFNHNKLILSIDRLDYTKGIIERLLAFENFLEYYSQWHNRVNMMLIVVPSRTEIDCYCMLKSEIDSLVGRINGKFSSTQWMPISYYYKQFNAEELVTLYSASDIAMLTPVRDGMNLIAKEYIASRSNHTGVLILSKRAGASNELQEGLLVNPEHTFELTDALLTALTLTEKEQARKILTMQQRLKAYGIKSWVEDFLLEVIEIRSENVFQKRANEEIVDIA